MFAITGATGQLGRLTISELSTLAATDRIVALVRDPARAADRVPAEVEARRFDYDVPGELSSALAGVERLLLISSDNVDHRVVQHRAVIDAAKTAGVRFIAYTSVLHADANPLSVAPSHRETEAMLRDSGMSYAILRNGWYIENYLIGADAAIKHGVLPGSTGAGRISAAARADYAAAAAIVLSQGSALAGIHELAGDDSFTLPDVAAALAEASGRPVVYKDLSKADYALFLERSGMPAFVAATLAGYSADSAGGVLADNSHTLSRLIGRRTTTLRQMVSGAIGFLA